MTIRMGYRSYAVGLALLRSPVIRFTSGSQGGGQLFQFFIGRLTGRAFLKKVGKVLVDAYLFKNCKLKKISPSEIILSPIPFRLTYSIITLYECLNFLDKLTSLCGTFWSFISLPNTIPGSLPMDFANSLITVSSKQPC